MNKKRGVQTTYDLIHSKRPLAGPAMKASLPFVAGILISGHFHPAPLITLAMLGLGILLLVVANRSDRIGSLSALAVMMLAGICVSSIEREINKPLYIPVELTADSVMVEGRVTGSPRHFSGNTYLTLDCSVLNTGSSTYNVSGELPCAIYGKTLLLNEGAILKVRGKIRRIRHLLTERDILRGSARRRYIYRLIADSKSPEPVITVTGGSVFSAIRTRISRLTDRFPYGGYRNILRAMTIGERDGIPQETRERFAQTGIAHILAVSGLHVGILTIVLLFFIKLFSFPRRFRYLLIIIFMVLYAGVCGFRPPVTRSVIMVLLVAGALFSERPKNPENSLFVALIIILAIDPGALTGASLQLSFAAVWTITTFYKPLMELPQKIVRRNRLFKKVYSLFIVSLLASAGTAPITAAHFGSLPLYGIPSNLLAVPLAFLIVSGGMLSIAASAPGAFTEPLAAVLSFFTGVFLKALDLLAEFVSSLPFSTIETGKISLLTGCVFAAWLYILSRSRGRPVFKKALLYIPMVLMLIAAWNPLVSASLKDKPGGTVVFFDVGQGDAALVKCGENRFFLFDTGPRYKNTNIAESMILTALKNTGINSLDGIFISHLHEDHVGGLDSIVRHFRVDRIFCRRALEDSLISLYGDRVIGLSAGDSIAFSEGGMLVLSPGDMPDIFTSGSQSGENNRSLVIRCDTSGVRALFTGDIEKEIQQLMISWGPALKADILKTPHHGARGLDYEFVRAVEPSVSVISCGAGNRYGHPAQTTITTLSQAHSSIWRTDSHGTILIKLPGLTVYPYESNYYRNK